MYIQIERGKSCIIAEIAGISYGGRRPAEKVLAEIAKIYAACPLGGGGAAANVLIWTQRIESKSEWHYGDELAEYITKADLGEVYGTPPANNIHYAHKPEKFVRAFTWSVDRPAFLAWWKAQQAAAAPPKSIYEEVPNDVGMVRQVQENPVAQQQGQKRQANEIYV